MCSCTPCRAADPNDRGQKISPYAKIAHDKSESQRNSLSGRRGRAAAREIFHPISRNSGLSSRGGSALSLWPPTSSHATFSGSQPLLPPSSSNVASTQGLASDPGAEEDLFHHTMEIHLNFDDGGQTFVSAPVSNHDTPE